MTRRAAPPIDQVAGVLARGLDVNRQMRDADAARDDWLRDCVAHEPRPTNRQIGEAIGLTEGEIRRRLRLISEAEDG